MGYFVTNKLFFKKMRFFFFTELKTNYILSLKTYLKV